MPNRDIALLGCGNWGRNILRNLSEMGCLRAVCDVDEQVAGWASRGYPGIDVSTDYLSVLSRDDINAVCVATDASSHYAVAKDVLLSGKDVFVEKPMALSVAEANDLCGLASRGGRILMVGHLMLYTSALEELKSVVPQLGKLLYVHAQRTGFSDPQPDVGVLWDLGPHEISMLLHILGAGPSGVRARGRDFSGNGKDDFVSLELDFPDQLEAHIQLSWWFPSKIRKFMLVGEKGSAVWDDLQGEFKLEYSDSRMVNGKAVLGRTSLVSLPVLEPLRIELQHFVESCARRTEPKTGGQSGLAVTKVLASAEKSMLYGKPTRVEE